MPEANQDWAEVTLRQHHFLAIAMLLLASTILKLLQVSIQFSQLKCKYGHLSTEVDRMDRSLLANIGLVGGVGSEFRH
jgi:hypothetical protein